MMAGMNGYNIQYAAAIASFLYLHMQVKTAYDNRVNLSAQGFYVTDHKGMDWSKGKGQPYLYYCYGVGCTEVEIDTLTGDFKVHYAVHSCITALTLFIDLSMLCLLNISPACSHSIIYEYNTYLQPQAFI